MCGITGIFSNHSFNFEESIRKMNLSIIQRGPDANCIWTENNVALGHLRLSIIDLSTGANQPMHSHSERYVMVFNGEIYNFQEIAKEIEQEKTDFKGWKTTSDTEVILEAFEFWGVDFVNKLNGMFAIAIYDKQENKINLFRDRLGIKPIFYYLKDGFFAFASELKALMQVAEIKSNAKINKSVVSQFFNLGYIPEPNSIYTDIYKFPAGSHGIYEENKLTIKNYWNVSNHISENTINKESEALNTLKGLVESSVKYRMISDVPFGTFLSGGIDSSLVTAVAQSVSDTKINSFSIGFKEKKFNESEYAAEVAKYIGTNHTSMIISEKEGLDLIPNIMDIYDEPYADSSAIPTMMVSMMAKKHVTMTLSGDGGDELFHGYGMYQWAKRMNNPFVKTFRSPISSVLKMGNNRMKRASEVFDAKDYSKIKSHIFSQEQYYFSQDEVDSLVKTDFKSSWNEKQYNNLKRTLNPSEKQSLFDIEHYLKDDLLVKVDRASMQHALEVRVPLLDYRIVEFAINLSSNLKVKDKTAKYLLKELLYQYVPKELFNRPKWGFSIPLSAWLKTDLRDLLEYYTSKEIIEKHDILNYSSVDSLKNRYFKGEDYLYNRLWLVMVFNMWCEKSRKL
ncbi:MAG: asparagine synthase (glutamine-hydrolyzing) [Bacteroidota bacterium]